MSSIVLRNAEVGSRRIDVRIEHDVIATMGPPGSVRGADVEIGCAGGALLPGLHDHHLHLLSMAAALGSVEVSDDLDRAIRQAHAVAGEGSWLRAVGYDDASAGPLDRWRLDALAPGRPVRVQHRSGAMWVLSSTALQRTGARQADADGIERDERGEPTGRLFRLDGWLRSRLANDRPPPDLAAVGRRLAAFGVTGVTDCTPTDTLDGLRPIADAMRTGALPLTVMVTGGPALAEVEPPEPLLRGPVKLVIADHQLPALEEVVAGMRRAHRAGRAVAVHCVTRTALVLAVAAWQEAGPRTGDRVEHASVAPPDLIAALAGLGVAVVTQPAFIEARGDTYLRDVDPADRPFLYPCASLVAAGIEVSGSTDAPFGPDDPWAAMRAAAQRRSRAGLAVGPAEAIPAEAALDLFLAPLGRPGGGRRDIRVDGPADLCLLDRPLSAALTELSSRHVALTIAAGAISFAR